MPQQLIYTSAPRGVVAGRSGYCTVARSAAMREALVLQLEKFCYYQHLSLSGGQERPIYACRIVDIRGTRYHVLSRIQDAGLDFTGRTNFIAHHLVFSPEEIRQNAAPPVILGQWAGWLKSWTQEPQLLENEDWSALVGLAGRAYVPAQAWQRVTGDAVNGYGLLEAHAGASFRVDGQPDETVLELIAESLELLEVRDPRKDFRATAWNYTFTTSMQEQDNPADFRWRCIHSDNPAASRFAPPDCRDFSAVRATKWTGEEAALAHTGRQPPRFVVEPQDLRITDGEAARFTVKADGVPPPVYQWFAVDRANNAQILPGATKPELLISNPALGVSRFIANATNSAGTAQSTLATLSVEKKLKLTGAGSGGVSLAAAKPGLYSVKSEDDIERQRKRLEAEKAEEMFLKKLRRNKILVAILTIALTIGGGAFALKTLTSKKSSAQSPVGSLQQRENPTSPTNGPSNTQANPNDEPAHTAVLRSSSDHGLPNGWSKIRIGSVTDYNADYITNTMPPRYAISAIAQGFLTNGDNVFFICKTNSGSEFEAELSKIISSTLKPMCGIMIRESQKNDSPFLFIGGSFQTIFVCRRNAKGEFAAREVDLSKAAKGEPLKLKFDRMNDISSPLYYDSISKRWRVFTDYTFSSITQTFIGFAISSGDSSENASAQFVDISPTNSPATKQ